MSRYHTSGNGRPHVVHHGYSYGPRVPGPLYREPEQGRWVKPLVWLMLGFAALLIAGNTWGPM